MNHRGNPRGNRVAYLPAVQDDDGSQHVEYVPRVVRRKTAGQRALLAFAVGLGASIVLYAIVFAVLNPDSYQLLEETREFRRTWVRAIGVGGTLSCFALAAYWQWPYVRRDRDGIPMPVATKDALAMLRHRIRA